MAPLSIGSIYSIFIRVLIVRVVRVLSCHLVFDQYGAALAERGEGGVVRLRVLQLRVEPSRFVERSRVPNVFVFVVAVCIGGRR